MVKKILSQFLKMHLDLAKKKSLNLMTNTFIFIKNMLCCYNWYLILCLLFLMLNMEHLLMMVFWLYNILECSFKFICKLASTLCLKLINPWNILPGTFNVCTKCYFNEIQWPRHYFSFSLYISLSIQRRHHRGHR